MKTKILLTLIVLICSTGILQAAGTVLSTPKDNSNASYSCLEVNDGDIVIDGLLNEKVWMDAPVIKFLNLVNGSEPTIPSYAKMLWDEKYIYVGYTIFDSNIVGYYGERVKGGSHEHLDKTNLHTGEPEIMFRDSFLKFLIDPDADGRNYIEIHINPLNNVSDLTLSLPYPHYPQGKECRKELNLPLTEKTVADWSWNCQGLKSAVSINGTLNYSYDKDLCWSVELAVPWEALKKFSRGPYSPVLGKNIWKAHLGHVYNGEFDYAKRRLSAHEYATWPVIGILNCHLPNKWGEIKFIKKQ